MLGGIKLFNGIYTPIVTPFDKNERIDYNRMDHNLEKWGKTDLDGIVVLGSNGEFVYLNDTEKVELVNYVIKNFNQDKKIIVGASCESTIETITSCEKYSKIGADAALVLPPHYYKGSMKESVLHKYFEDVADKSPIPLMIYNMPGNTGINLSSNLIARLSQHKNIVGIKDTSGNIVQISEIVRDTSEDFSVFAGNAGYLLPALSVGARGATLALANVLPQECCELVSLFRDRKFEEARKLQLKLIEINFAVTGKLGVAGLKYSMDLMGYMGGEVRRPLTKLTLEEEQYIEKLVAPFRR